MSNLHAVKDNTVHEINEIDNDSESFNSIDTTRNKVQSKKWYHKSDWYHPVKYKTAEERNFVRKLDSFLISWTIIAYLIKSIDQSNVSNAYVSGMKEDLHFEGTDYNRLDTFFRIGYAIFLVPSQVMLQQVNPAYWLSSCELIWGILTALCAVATKPAHLYPIRFFMGVFESSSWPGIINILFNYYNRDELVTRISLFQISSYAASMFAGFMQASIHKTLNGKQGISGWKWMFIINGCMTIVVGISGFFIVPDSPADGGAKYWMNDGDRKIALERVERAGIKTKRGITFKDFYATFIDWKVWLFVFSFSPKAWCSASSYFNLYLKSLKKNDGTSLYSVEQLNTIPVGGYAIQVVSILFFGVLSQLTGEILSLIIVQGVLVLFSNIVLAVWPKSTAFKFAAFYIMQGAEGISPMLLSLLSEVYSRSPQRRSIATGISVVFVYANIAWLQLILWPASQAPRYKYGYKASCGLISATVIDAALFFYFCYKPALKINKENEAQRAQEQGEVEQDISVDDHNLEISRFSSLNHPKNN